MTEAVKADLLEQPQQAMVDALTTGTGVMRGGQRVDPFSIYAEQPQQEKKK